MKNLRTLQRIRYYTMNSWNRFTAPAYNLKIYKVIRPELRDRVYEMMEVDDFYDDINMLISDFNREQDYTYQAGFNGRSGGYLVLYRGGRDTKEITETLFKDPAYNNRVYISDRLGWMSLEVAKKWGILGKTITTRIWTQPGQNIDEKDVPGKVLRAFRRLALDIIRDTEYKARHCKVEEESYTVIKTRKVLVESGR